MANANDKQTIKHIENTNQNLTSDVIKDIEVKVVGELEKAGFPLKG